MHKDNFPIKFWFFKDCSASNIQFLPHRNVLLPITKASLSWLKSQTIHVKEIHEGAMLQAAKFLTLQYVVYVATSVLNKVTTVLNDAAPRKNRSVCRCSGYVALSILPRSLGLLHSSGVRGLVQPGASPRYQTDKKAHKSCGYRNAAECKPKISLHLKMASSLS